MKRFNPQARHQARYKLVQALYQWQVTKTEISPLVVQFTADMNEINDDVPYFKECLSAIINSIEHLDTVFEPYLDRAISDLGAVEISILRLSCFELSQRPDIPCRVVLNEAIKLAKTFAAEEGHKYINGVLDKVASHIRKDELSQ